MEQPVGAGDVIHLVGNFDEFDQAIVDRERNFVIINPDKLIRVTSIGNNCTRRCVLEEKLKVRCSGGCAMLHVDDHIAGAQRCCRADLRHGDPLDIRGMSGAEQL